MHPRIPDLLAYYLSDEFAQDYPNFLRRDPAAAAAQRQLIIEQLEINSAALGVTLTPDDRAVHAAFAAGSMSTGDMLDYLKVYASTISLRWPPVKK
jgi:hypothetical protein